MKENFRPSLSATLKYEGGYSNHPSDPGGPTMRGVTQRVYDAWRKHHGKLPQSVRNISNDELEAIYKRDYWDRCRCDDLPSGVDLAVFDFAVNSGPSRAVKYLQGVVDVPQDGIVGPVTINAVRTHPHCCAALCDARLKFMQRLKTWNIFGKGWGDRVADVKRKCLAMAKAHPQEAPHEQEKSVFDEVLDTIDWTRPHAGGAAIPTETSIPAQTLQGHGIYILAAIIAAIGALNEITSAEWTRVVADPSHGLPVILSGIGIAILRSLLPQWAGFFLPKVRHF